MGFLSKLILWSFTILESASTPYSATSSGVINKRDYFPTVIDHRSSGMKVSDILLIDSIYSYFPPRYDTVTTETGNLI